MQYVGSKARIAKRLLAAMPERKPGQVWFEPFVGGGNMIQFVENPRVGCDDNPYLIALLAAVADGWEPPTTLTREEYYAIKREDHLYPDHLVGFAAFLCSFGGKWWGGYAHDSKGDNYAERGSRVLVKQAERLAGVQFIWNDYRQVPVPKDAFIYADPPYANATTYGFGDEMFDHEAFWNWCRERHAEGHQIYVSEYAAPDDFERVLEIPTKTILDRNSQYPRIERLFKPKGG